MRTSGETEAGVDCLELEDEIHDLEKRSASTTQPGPDDFVVSKHPIAGKVTYETIEEATKAIWNSASAGRLATVFIYAGL